jgi:hypothetical protein
VTALRARRELEPAWHLACFDRWSENDAMNITKSALAATGLAVIFATVTGCYASVEPAYAEADYVPADIETYPHTYYEGRDVYFVNDRYYYRGPHDHWVYYRTAPAPLVERRATYGRTRPYVQQAPEVRERRYDEGRDVAPQVRAPEPATQVR